MTQTIGIQAKLDLGSNWSANVSRYLDDVSKMTGATHKAGGSISGSFSGLGGVSGVLGGIGSALDGVATVAGGIITANLFGRLADGIGGFVSNSINAIDQAQQLEMGLNALMTSNLLYEKSIQEVTTAQTKELMTEGEFIQKQEELTAKLNLQRASMQEQKQRVIDLTAAWGSNGLATIEAQARLDQMGVQIQATEQDLSGLTRTETTYGSTTETTYKQVRSLAEAQKLAAQQTKELQRFVEDLAVTSPFEEGQVAIVSKLAAGAGRGVDAIKNFTTGFLDLSAAVGITSENLAFAGDQLLQVAKVGKLTTIDLRQLRRMGIDLEKIIGTQMSMSIDEFNAAAEKSPEIFNQLFDAVGKFSASNFPGAAKKMATSVSGLKSTFSDLVKVAGRRLFEPLVETLTPTISTILEKFSGLIAGGELANIGQQMAGAVNHGLIVGRVLMGAFERGGVGEVAAAVGNMLKSAWPDIQAMMGQGAVNVAGLLGISPEMVTQAQGFFGQITDIFSQVQQGQGGDLLKGWVAQVIANIPGTLSQLTTSISTWLVNEWPTIQNTLGEWANKFWEWTNTAIGGAGQALGGVLIAVGAWANSPEAQAQLNQIGMSIGNALVTFIAPNAEQNNGVMLKIATGLAAMVVGAMMILIEIGGQLVAGIFAGIGNALTGGNYKPWTIAQFRQFAGWIGSIDWGAVGKGLMDKIGAGLAETANTIAQTLTNSINAWKKIITDARWVEIGKGIIDGLLKGLRDNSAKVLEYLKGLAGSMISDTMAIFGVHSPSTVFADIGSNLIAGLLQGVDTTSPQFQQSLDKLFNINRSVNSLSAIVGSAADDLEKYFDIQEKLEGSKSRFALANLKKIFKDNAAAILNATNRAEKFKEIAMSALNWEAAGFSGEPGRILQGAFSRFITYFDKYKVQLGSALTTSLITGTSKMIQTANSMNDLAKAAVEQSNSKVDTLAALLNSGQTDLEFEGKIISTTEAQQKLNEAMEEQKRIQGELLQLQSNESKLSFLQKQLDLLQTVQKAGLNTADIFGGIGFGLDASMSDLVAATNRVVSAMISQANSDLDIHSPSGKFEKIGELAGRGLQGGWEKMAGGIMNSIQGTMSQIVSPYQSRPVYATAGASGPTLVFNIGSIANRADADYFAERVRREVATAL